MKFYLKLGLILLAFCIVATALLAYINSVTAPRIAEQKRLEAEKAREELIPGASFGDPVAIPLEPGKQLEYYIARDPKDPTRILGYVFITDKYGYSSSVKTMAAVDSTFRIINIKVIEQAETPGLGANCVSDPDFSAQFRTLGTDDLKVDKDGGTKVKSLTGATITTRAITNSLKEAIQIVRDNVKGAAKNGTEVNS